MERGENIDFSTQEEGPEVFVSGKTLIEGQVKFQHIQISDDYGRSIFF